VNDLVLDMDALAQNILGMFVAFDKPSLDLHTVRGWNDPDTRAAVLDAVGRLVRMDCWRSASTSFYALTTERIAKAQPPGKAWLS